MNNFFLPECFNYPLSKVNPLCIHSGKVALELQAVILTTKMCVSQLYSTSSNTERIYSSPLKACNVMNCLLR